MDESQKHLINKLFNVSYFLAPQHLILVLQRNVVPKNPVFELKSEARNPKQYRMSKIRVFKTKSAIQQQQTFGILVI